ncbi:MAG: hypothetical protein DMD82_04200 [Candidatus Rokuibacteriota bacterium]|nr:MAG: hypothetical protein DMD82_04200 [Candidatus Rokubacteria bacterium]
MGGTKQPLRALAVAMLVLMAVFFCGPAAGQEVDSKGGRELTELGHKIDKASNRAASDRVVEKIVAEFKGKFTESDVQGLRKQGLGFGEISILLALASKSGKSVDDILKMRRSGEGWGELAHDLGLKNLGSIIRSVRATAKGVDRGALAGSERRRDGLEQAGRPDKPEKFGRAERMERHERSVRPEQRAF